MRFVAFDTVLVISSRENFRRPRTLFITTRCRPVTSSDTIPSPFDRSRFESFLSNRETIASVMEDAFGILFHGVKLRTGDAL